MAVTDEGFYEDDEPIEDIKAVFARGPWAVTWPPPSNFMWTLEHGLRRIPVTSARGWSYVRPVQPGTR